MNSDSSKDGCEPSTSQLEREDTPSMCGQGAQCPRTPLLPLHRPRTVIATVQALLCMLVLCAASSNAIEMDRCADRSCYPATGNLLIGREKQLTVTSTCGAEEPERYCIVSYLEDEKKCFYCDSRAAYVPEYNEQSHRVENIVTEHFEDRQNRWWQSENGVQNISMRLDLEAEFHFTHMVITFKSFRPASMIIERSSDYGKTWKVYRYFSDDCAGNFPKVEMGVPRKHADVVCTEQYSGLQPSTKGEVVLKVLSPHIPLDDPYSNDTQDLIRITNLRVNFTKMHTLGDDLLDSRPEILEKYFYAIYDMVIRGSCSCYGHAKYCVPIEGDGVQFINQRQDMVHGRCECTHNTQGLNCETCAPFYNDLPWLPATETDTKECKRCNCNSHASQCHFDPAVYEISGFVSGGVCDDCQHNTMGRNCEQCKPYYYHDPQRPITDAYVCLPCRCDVRGAENDGLCDSETDESRELVAGRCHCKLNVDGEYCDRCKHGYWNMNDTDPKGCTQCACETQGTPNNEGCNKHTGECICKRFVTGDRCDKCLPEHYGLSSEPEGCKACDCDIGGSYNNDCDITTGQCSCRQNFGGRTCKDPESGFFCPNIDYLRYEAENANMTKAAVDRREPRANEAKGWTGIGYAKVQVDSMLTLPMVTVPHSNLYSPVIRYESRMPNVWQEVTVMFVRPSDPAADGPCANQDADDDVRQTQVRPGAAYVEVYPPVCLEQDVDYEVLIKVGAYQPGVQATGNEHMFLDSLILTPPTDELEIFANNTPKVQQHKDMYERYQCRHAALSLTPMHQLHEVCQRYVCPIAAVTVRQAKECECNPTGSKSGICDIHGGQCDCKENVVGRSCDKCAEATYGFGPAGCKRCECDSVGSLHNFCDQFTGNCLCNKDKSVRGRQCNECELGFWGFPQCRPCQCNDHADVCDQKTGACIECRDLTQGHYCDMCKNGYYGDPRMEVAIACRACPCPGGPGSGKQHAETCVLQSGEDSVQCHCKPGYEGTRCDECSMNHWGTPKEVGGQCVSCECNGNIDPRQPDSCDALTGECTKCLYNTVGDQCQYCAEGYFGDAKTKTCRECICNRLGTNSTAGECDRVSGQCPCLPNVDGQQCDQCAVNHWKLASGEGCDACECDPTGVRMDENGDALLQCNDFDGACACKAGRGGRKCDQCQDYYWGEPTIGDCQRCECNQRGSAQQQCHRNNGTCVCLAGSGGAHCDECARGYTGQWPYCEACGECFQNWDATLSELSAETKRLVEQANNIEDTGVASIYDSDFKELEEALGTVRKQLDAANITKDDIDNLRAQMDALDKALKQATDKINKLSDDRLTGVTAKVDQAHSEFDSLQEQSQDLVDLTTELQEAADKLREGDVEGAYNITKESADKSQAAKQDTQMADSYVAESETKRREAKQLFERNQEDFDKQFTENQDALNDIGDQITELESQIPSLNEQVCGAPGDPCDDVCGGPTCLDSAGMVKCGGPSCDLGSVTNAEQAKTYATRAADILETKQLKANQLLSNIENAVESTEDAKREADSAFVAAKAASQQANQTRQYLKDTLGKLTEFLEKDRSNPAQIRSLAEEILGTEITLTPEEIKELSDQIRTNLQKLENIDSILDETRGNLTVAQNLKDKADLAKQRAEAILNTTTGVREALDKAEQAQEKAQSAITQAQTDIDTAQDDLKTIELETEAAEAAAEDSNGTLTDLSDSLDAVRRKYVKVEQNVKNAQNATETANGKTSLAEDSRDQLGTLYDEAELELRNKGAGDKTPKDRAERLRQTASKMLEKTQKYKDKIKSEGANFDSNDVRLEQYGNELEELNNRMDTSTATIQNELNRFETCD